ncbi:MAG: autotransporter domain-containing protein [Chthoniobacteraceae bacterium]
MKKTILTAVAVTSLFLGTGVSWGQTVTSTNAAAESGANGGHGFNGLNGNTTGGAGGGGGGAGSGGGGGGVATGGNAGGNGYTYSGVGGTGGAAGSGGSSYATAGGGGGGGGGGGADGGHAGVSGDPENITWISGNNTITITTVGSAGGNGGIGGNGGNGGDGASYSGYDYGSNGGSGGSGGGGGGGGIGGNGGNIIFFAPTAASLTGGINLTSTGAAGGNGGNGGDGGSAGAAGAGYYYYGSNGSVGAGGNGGNGGAGGIGGSITGTNQATLTVLGITAISTGANGGDGGQGGYDGNSVISGSGGAGGNGGAGGAITLTNLGKISTSADEAVGISAYSNGGDGGDGGYGSTDGKGGNGGDGGDISIVNTGVILTTGSWAHGIEAISLGGAAGTGLTNGSVGTGGNITIYTSGNINVSGSSTAAIYAQSTGGSDSAGKGDLNVTIAGYTSGGTGNSVGVYFGDGASSTLTITGTGVLTTASGVKGLAVYSDLNNTASDVVYNSGTLIGSVNLVGDGGTAIANTNTVYNEEGGVYYSGSTVNLGAGNTFYNSGFVLIGGYDTILNTQLTGNYTQESTGVTGVKIGGTSQGITYDHASVSGTAYVDGTLRTYQANKYVPNPINANVHWNLAADSFTVVTAGTLQVASTAVIDDYFVKNYLVRLDQDPLVTSTSLTLVTKQSTFDTLYHGYTDGLTHNQRAVAKALDKAIVASDWNGGTDSRADKLIYRLDDIDKVGLRTALDQIAPEELGLVADAALGVVRSHEISVQSRLTQLRLPEEVTPLPVSSGKDKDGKKAVVAPEGDLNGFYAFGNVNTAKVKDDNDILGGKDDAYGVTLGYDRQVSSDIRLGLAGTYLYDDLKFNSGGKTKINDFSASVYAQWIADGFFLNGLAGGGAGSYDITRSGLDRANVNGSTDGEEVHVQIATGYDVPIRQFTITPNASLGYTNVWLNGYTEDGSLAPLKISDIKNTASLRSRLGASVNYHGTVAGKAVTPEIGLYWQHEFLDTDHSVTAHLASGAGGTFTVDSASTERDSLTPTVAVNVKLTSNVDVRLAGEAALLNRAPSFNGNAGVSISW